MSRVLLGCARLVGAAIALSVVLHWLEGCAGDPIGRFLGGLT